jgi:hypothetical protein
MGAGGNGELGAEAAAEGSLRIYIVRLPQWLDVPSRWGNEMKGGDCIWDQVFRYTTESEASMGRKL